MSSNTLEQPDGLRFGRRRAVRYGLVVLGSIAVTLVAWPGLLRHLFSSDYMPHAMCLAYDPKLLSLHVVADGLIGLSYAAISLTLVWLVHRARRDIPFQWVFLAFGLFIIACGATHFMEIVTLWKPFYWLSGEVKLITAMASLATAMVLPPLVPRTLAIIQSAKMSDQRQLQLETANRELERLTAKLREMDEIKTAFFANEAIPHLVWSARPDGYMVYLNRRWCEYTGIPAEQAQGWTWESVVHPDDLPRSLEAWRHSLESGEVFQMECRVRRYDGQYRWFWTRALPMRDGRGQITAWFGTCTDIDDQRRAEQVTRELAAIVESSENAIVGKTLEGVITSWNAAAARTYGYTRDEALGKPISLLSPPDRKEEMNEILRKLKQAEKIDHFRTQRQTKDGRIIDVALTVSPVKDTEGKVIGASTIARDITEQKRAEELLRNSEKLATVGRLAASIAHEINNPLEAVSNALYLLHDHPGVDVEARNYVDMAEQEVARIGHIVKQTLGFYRESLAPVRVNAGQLLENVLDLYARKIQAAKLEVEKNYELAEEIPVFPGEMRQVFSNLLVNAIEASTAGSKLRIHVYPSRDWAHPSRPGVRVVVADYGTGISRENLKRLFEAFFTTKGERGTGLGLWVSHGIIVKHGGTIRVHSSTRPGRSGTVFSVFLPCDAMRVEETAAD